KHYGCWLRGIRIELHRIAGQLPSRSTDRKFQQWSESQLRDSRACLMFGEEQVHVPTPLFDVVFVFMHLYLHFLNGGIGLRHICDWAMLMHAHAGKINPVELEWRLKEFRLLKAWRRFAPIAVEHLGIPPEECPCYSTKNRGEAERILSFILKEGNFGRAGLKDSCRPEGYLAGKLYSFKRHTLRIHSKFRIDPNTISRTYCSYLIKGFTRVIKDLLNRN
ncbi:MAG: nucleotidyltransferase family protein, partial [Muribaculaceae bacterium]|nr:nucleotidyltransferase family protein [Muribaculaceae bacterium]